MVDMFPVLGKRWAYGDLGEAVGASFKGLCTTFKISEKCFQALIEDGWDDAEQLGDLTDAWKVQVLALAPNGGQRRNLEKLIQRVEAGPLHEQVQKKKRRHEEADPPPQDAATGQVANRGQGAGSSDAVDTLATTKDSTSAQVF